MSIQTQVLVDGVWTTRTVDLQTVLERNREPTSRAPDPPPPDEVEPAPYMGILTKTIIASPIVRWIIPARIRNEEKNDVLFIGDTFVQIKELQPDGRLQDVALKNDFGARIRHARVFGTPRVPAPYEGQTSGHLLSGLKGPRSSFGKPSIAVPPQILVVSLDTGHLVFLFTYESADGHVNIETSERVLPSRTTVLEEPGKHIAVDPKSRALAVAASERLFVLYALHPASTFKVAIGKRGFLEPKGVDFIKQERHVIVDGDIVRMEFLHPSPGDEQHVILLLVVSTDKKIRFLVFEWDCSRPLQWVQEHSVHGLQVGDPEKQPLLLIPLMISSAFLLVSETTISAYTRMHTGVIQRKFVGQTSKDPAVGIRSLQRVPVYTAWARPLRHKVYSTMHDDVYICREDGLVRLVEIDQADKLLVKTTSPAGALRGFIGTAFASLDLPPNSKYDMLIAGGDMSLGGIYLISPKQEAPECVDFIPNWTPVTDAVIASPAVRQPRFKNTQSLKLNPYYNDKVFVCSGRGEHGSITEIRYGVQARIGFLWPYRSGGNRVWSFQDETNSGTILVISFPFHTEVLHFSQDLQSAEQRSELETEGLALDTKTLAAGQIGSAIVQVTPNSVSGMSLSPFSSSKALRVLSVFPADQSILEACLHLESASIVTAIRTGDQIQLSLTRVQFEEGTIALFPVGHPLDLPSEPTHLSTMQFGKKSYVLVGTTFSTLQIFHLDSEHGLSPTLEHNFDDDSEATNFAICDSIAVLRVPTWKTNPIEQSCLMLCGLRNGFMALLTIELMAELDIAIIFQRLLRVGNTSVAVIPDTLASDMAFLACGAEFFRIRVEDDGAGIQLWSIWLTLDYEPAYYQGSINTLTRILSQDDSAGPKTKGTIACLSADKLIIFKIDEQPRAVPRHVAIGASPKKILYSVRLGLLVVAYSKLASDADQRHGNDHHWRNQRDVVSSLKLIDPHNGPMDPRSYRIEFRASSANDPATSSFTKSGEQVLSMMDWICTDANKRYHYIVLGTGFVGSAYRATSKWGGRMLLLAVSKSATAGISMRQNFAIMLTGPVASVAAFGTRCLVASSGVDICLGRLNVVDKKFEKIGGFTLRSAAVHVSVEEPYIYVSTISDSLTILRVNDEELVQVFGDGVARLSESHLTLPHLSLTLVSDKECCVTGLWYPPKPLASSSESRNHPGSLDGRDVVTGEALFEAELPVSIVRFQLGHLRPAWQHLQDLPGRINQDDHETGMDSSPTITEIFGFSEDGSMYQFILLSDAAWRVLRFIQNLVSRKPIPYYNQVIWPSKKEQLPPHPHLRHVDGDLLARLAEKGPESLRAILMTDATSFGQEQRHVAVEHSAASYPRFVALLEGLLGKSTEDPVDAFLKYVRKLLQPSI